MSFTILHVWQQIEQAKPFKVRRIKVLLQHRHTRTPPRPPPAVGQQGLLLWATEAPQAFKSRRRGFPLSCSFGSFGSDPNGTRKALKRRGSETARVAALWTSTNLWNGNWTPCPDGTNMSGHDAMLAYTNSAADSTVRHFRLTVRRVD